jgi:hypothetical protein
MSNLVASYRVLGELDNARSLGEEAVAELREVLGPTHPQTISTIRELASTLEESGQAQAARELDAEVFGESTDPHC